MSYYEDCKTLQDLKDTMNWINSHFHAPPTKKNLESAESIQEQFETCKPNEDNLRQVFLLDRSEQIKNLTTPLASTASTGGITISIEYFFINGDGLIIRKKVCNNVKRK